MGKNSPRIVTIGGGTGSFAVLSGLKNYVQDITAVVNMADDGGSTGVLRDEFGVLPPGDVRQCIVALSKSSMEIRKLFQFRFATGSLEGHSFGNLFLSALEQINGDFASAVKTASQILNITGQVLPVTLDPVQLILNKPNGKKIIGEYKIANIKLPRKPNLQLSPKPKINPSVIETIERADMIVIAPGNLYGSLAPALLVPELGRVIARSSAKKVFISNLVTKPGQTDKFTVRNYVDEIERFAGCRFVEFVLYNSTHPTKSLLSKYANENEYAVEVGSKTNRFQLISADLLSNKIARQDPNDRIIRRTLIRHDSDKVARQLMRLYFS